MIIITREIFTVLITMMEIIQKWSEISRKKTLIDTHETQKRRSLKRIKGLKFLSVRKILQKLKLNNDNYNNNDNERNFHCSYYNGVASRIPQN